MQRLQKRFQAMTLAGLQPQPNMGDVALGEQPGVTAPIVWRQEDIGGVMRAHKTCGDLPSFDEFSIHRAQRPGDDRARAIGADDDFGVEYAAISQYDA